MAKSHEFKYALTAIDRIGVLLKARQLADAESDESRSSERKSVPKKT